MRKDWGNGLHVDGNKYFYVDTPAILAGVELLPFQDNMSVLVDKRQQSSSSPVKLAIRMTFNVIKELKAPGMVP